MIVGAGAWSIYQDERKRGKRNGKPGIIICKIVSGRKLIVTLTPLYTYIVSFSPLSRSRRDTPE